MFRPLHGHPQVADNGMQLPVFWIPSVGAWKWSDVSPDGFLGRANKPHLLDRICTDPDVRTCVYNSIFHGV